MEIKDIYTEFGYRDFGPLMFGFCKWLEREMRAEDITKVFFLSRDGFFMKKVFDAVTVAEFDTHYLYASRRLLQVASICDKQTYENTVQTMYFPRTFKGSKLIKAWGCSTLLNEASIELKEKIINRNNLLDETEFKAFFEENRDEIIKNSLEEKRALIDYLKENSFEGKLAIVDIGWFGNMQNSLETILSNCDIDCEICGYYLGVNPESNYFAKYKMRGFMFEPGKYEAFYKKEQFFENVLEVLFSAPHGSAVKYYYDGDEIKVQLEDSKYITTESFGNIKKIQDGAYEYCCDKVNGNNDIDEDTWEVSIHNIYRSLTYPKKKILDSVGELCLDEEEPVKLINARTTRYYIIHPKQFIRDFIDSYWKVGFMKKVIKLNLPYASILAKAKAMF